MLGLVLEQTPTVPMLHVLTFRPEFDPSWPPRSHMTPLTLNRLERPQVEALITHLAQGKALPHKVIEHIVAKTDGVPLYVEELTKMLMESEWLQEEADQYVLTGPLLTVAIPDTLQASLMARLDQMKTAKEVAQLGAVLGRDFPYDLIQAISSQEDETLQGGLAQLVESELLYQRGRPPRARYIFKHALIQDAAYASLLRSRRQQVHRQVAQQLEAMFPDMVETQPELVAHHYTAAGLGEPAVIYWQRAGDLANRRSAYPEAIAHVSQGLAVLETLPETPTRVDQEIRLRLALGRPLMAAHGIAAPQVGETYTRLRQLCAHGKDLALRFAALRGLRVFYTGRAEHHRAVEVSAEALRVAQQTNDPMLLAEGHLNAGVPHLYLGQLHRAIDHFTQGIVRPGTVSQPISGAALDVICRSHISIALWLLGYPDQAQQRHHEALTISQQRPDVFTQGMAQLQSLLYLALCREWPALHDQSVGLDEFATVGCLPQMKGIAAIMLGWYRAVRERDPDGIVQLHQGIEMFRNTAGDVFHPSWLARLAEAYAQIGKPEEALNTVAKAFEVMKAIDEYVHHAELCWIKGTMLRSYPKDRTEEAETCFHQSRNIARQQQAKSWELRAATSLTRLWQNQSKRQEAYDLLAPVYGWFTEGFDTADLKEAKTLLAELGRSSNPSA